LHDEILLGGIEHVVLIRAAEGSVMALALDITNLEQREFDLGLMVAGSALLLIALLGLAIAVGANRLVKPLIEIASRIAHLRPDLPGQRIPVPQAANAELVVIAEALNDYLQRNDQFVERERIFIDTASHELRTPIAVIGGACEMAIHQADLPIAARGQLMRIQRAVRDVEQLISLLLVLAKDPARIAKAADRVSLDQMLHEIIDDHRHLTRDKDLSIELEALPGVEILAPVAIVQAAIGNLLRNAIENSDRGVVRVVLEHPATVRIEDPGHGMTPEEISSFYARLAKSTRLRAGAGIGLDLIAKLCEHLGWHMELRSGSAQGTTAVLDFSPRQGPVAGPKQTEAPSM
jgi:signal transduction histidine kinase